MQALCRTRGKDATDAGDATYSPNAIDTACGHDVGKSHPLRPCCTVDGPF